MNHIEIYVKDLTRTRNFYSRLLEKLGYEIFQDWDKGFSYKKEKFYIVFVQVEDKYITNDYHRCNVGLNHLAFSCDDRSTIDEIRIELLNRGDTLLYDDRYPYAGGENHYALYFEDPDRIKLEIVLDK